MPCNLLKLLTATNNVHPILKPIYKMPIELSVVHVIVACATRSNQNLKSISIAINKDR